MAKLSLILKQQRPPKFKTRGYNRCSQCGKTRGFYRKFKLCRMAIRELGASGLIPGLVKSSW